ncbi:MAG: hypothetical protein NPIRA06_30780 [Nitrospirales bacterium]|nr:MAG: hypothetical protein NPIRA06_30780 [Nitrospirales bacterium]
MKQEREIQIVHALPGRVRLKLHRLKNNIAYAAGIQRDLLKMSGMNHVAANTRTSSLPIEYKQNIVEVLGLHPSVFSCLGLPLSMSKHRQEKFLLRKNALHPQKQHEQTRQKHPKRLRQ